MELWKRRRVESLEKARQVDAASLGPVRYIPIKGFPQHRVGDDGSVWAFRWDRKERGRWKRIKGTTIKPIGYLRVDIGRGGGKPTQLYLVHRLILECFVGPCPPGLEGLHKDDNPTNNRLENLKWGTRWENMKDRKKNRRKKGLSPWYDYPRNP